MVTVPSLSSVRILDMKDSVAGIRGVVEVTADTVGQLFEELGARVVPVDHPHLQVLPRDRCGCWVMRVVVARAAIGVLYGGARTTLAERSSASNVLRAEAYVPGRWSARGPQNPSPGANRGQW